MLAELSFPQNYVPTFLELKQKEEQKIIHLNDTDRENKSKPFSKEELTRAIQATKNSAPGPDKIYNEMLKHLLPEGLDSPLDLYNKIWQQEYFPEKSLESTIKLMSKPGKDPTNPSHYRPIVLTSVLCKAMDRKINSRLLDTANTAMWRQSQTNNHRPSFVSGSHCKEGPSKQ